MSPPSVKKLMYTGQAQELAGLKRRAIVRIRKFSSSQAAGVTRQKQGQIQGQSITGKWQRYTIRDRRCSQYMNQSQKQEISVQQCQKASRVKQWITKCRPGQKS